MTDTTDTYRMAVDLLGGVADAARATGIPRRTIEDRLARVFRVSPDAAREMANACRARAVELTTTADALDAAAERKEDNDATS
ncbi:MAG: hypothetical protein R6U63_13775 [Longimicrobiales bacterium]